MSILGYSRGTAGGGGVEGRRRWEGCLVVGESQRVELAGFQSRDAVGADGGRAAAA